MKPLEALDVSRAQQDFINKAETVAGSSDGDLEKLRPDERYVGLKRRLGAILWGETTPHLNIGEEYKTPSVTVAVSKGQAGNTLIGCRLRCQVGVPATSLTWPNSPDITVITAEWAHYPDEKSREQAFTRQARPRAQLISGPNPGGIYVRELVHESQVVHPAVQGTDQSLSSLESTLAAYELSTNSQSF